mmetsp:Transcript_9643/g.23805  ORF Transcript_9643/g.23805 Transcript_9643/m.23805 type:complete len:215 (-) Transcript_9643:661-1305(-)
MGRSPVFVTVTITPTRPALSGTSPPRVCTPPTGPRARADGVSPTRAGSSGSSPALRFWPVVFPACPTCKSWSKSRSSSGAGNLSFVGTGRNEPYSASSRSPSSVHMGSCTVTSLVPSGKVPSTCTSTSMSGTCGSTWRRPSMRRPTSISCATPRFLPSKPSRMSSSSCAAMSAVASGWLRRRPRARRRCARTPAACSVSLSISRGHRCISTGRR